MLLLSGLYNALRKTDNLTLKLPDGSSVPAHFHITEAGLITKHFIDCGGTVRKQSAITMQIWYSYDVDHRLTPEKLLKILDKAEPLIGSDDLPIEIEYQSSTIGKYNLDFDGDTFHLIPTETDCLAKEQCGVPGSIQAKNRRPEPVTVNACTPASGCC